MDTKSITRDAIEKIEIALARIERAQGHHIGAAISQALRRRETLEAKQAFIKSVYLQGFEILLLINMAINPSNSAERMVEILADIDKQRANIGAGG